ncbi:MAG: N-acetylglutaminylglutamine amidotransferase, partial [Pararhizobium sp.]
MCGICGEVRFDGGPASAAVIGAMTEALERRGPDASGIVLRGRVGFGHRRLRIIDLSESAEQPMVDSALGLTIAFNGCIYNYPELRSELEALGYRFFSRGDTEVILKAWHAWGADCVTRFNGMFAFVLHERDSGRVVMARDRFGIKPLYLAETGETLRFASSLPALLEAGGVDTSIDRVALNLYMTFHAVVPPPRTILNGVRKLPPATIRVIEPDGRRRDTVYWTPPFERDPGEAALTARDWRDRVLHELKQAVKRRMVADVPVGVLLSGGVDSSVIVGLLAAAGQKDLMTFSVGFEEANGEKGDEFVYSDLIAERFATDHHQIFVPSEKLMQALPETIAAMSEPMVSYDNVGFYLLSKEVSKHIKVVQSGQGADEVFGGSHWYPPLNRSTDAVADYARVFFDRSHQALRSQLGEGWTADEDEATAFVTEHFARPGAGSPVDKALRI